MKLAIKEVTNMTYKPVPWDNKLRKEVIDDLEALAIYEATKLQIELVIQLKDAGFKKNLK